MISNLGRIHEVPLREVWDNEATSFTPWLLQYEDVLAELLRTDITLTEEQWNRLDEVSAPPLPDYPYRFMDTMKGR